LDLLRRKSQAGAHVLKSAIDLDETSAVMLETGVKGFLRGTFEIVVFVEIEPASLGWLRFENKRVSLAIARKFMVFPFQASELESGDGIVGERNDSVRHIDPFGWGKEKGTRATLPESLS
jgi:hypothetical protein